MLRACIVQAEIPLAHIDLFPVNLIDHPAFAYIQNLKEIMAVLAEVGVHIVAIDIQIVLSLDRRFVKERRSQRRVLPVQIDQRSIRKVLWKNVQRHCFHRFRRIERVDQL